MPLARMSPFRMPLAQMLPTRMSPTRMSPTRMLPTRMLPTRMLPTRVPPMLARRSPALVRLSRVPAAALIFAGALSGCQVMSSGLGGAWDTVMSWTPPFLRPYRPDVHQGNIITSEMVDQLRVGMSRDQVRFMLGTPLLTSQFHLNRWEYAYYLNRLDGETQSRRLTVVFKDNKLERWSADPMPDETMADVLILGPNALKKTKSQDTVPVSPPPTDPIMQSPMPGSDL
jgi:outer membrane protein assembly factor BamE